MNLESSEADLTALQNGKQLLLPLGVLEQDDKIVTHACFPI